VSRLKLVAAAANVFLDFAVDVRAITHRAAQEYSNEIDLGLKETIKAQSTYQKLSDEVERFCDILRSCFISGDCHVLHHLNQGPPVLHAHTWGWRTFSGQASDENNTPKKTDDLQAKGQAIGWINETERELWLDPDSVFKVVQRFATAQGEIILMQKATLFKRCLERGLIIAHEIDSKSGTRRPDIKKTICSKRSRVLVFPTLLVTGGDDD